MSFTFIMTPETGSRKNDIETAVRACSYYRMDSVSISPVLALEYLRDDDWLKSHYAKELMEKCSKVVVVCDEVTEEMISQIKHAQELELPVTFLDSDRNQINIDALIINKRIGPGLRKMIMDVNGLSCADGECPYGTDCYAAEEQKPAAENQEEKKPSPEPKAVVEPVAKKSFFKKLFGGK